MDSLRSCVAPLQEYLLQGSILDTHCDLLLHRLSGLCDNIDTGPENFHDQDLVYTLRKYGSGGYVFIGRMCAAHKPVFRLLGTILRFFPHWSHMLHQQG